MQLPKHTLAQQVVKTCLLNAIKNIVISPGSRNAPLTIGFTGVDFFNTFSIVDERCAAFFALGMAQNTQQPTALVCTSGSALLNYYPAIAEAYFSNIPLIIISADRPSHLVNIGDGQTINQPNVFNNHVLFSANLEATQQQLQSNTSLIQNAISIAKKQQGPVHINVPFNEPLYDLVDEFTVTINLPKTEDKNDDLISDLSEFKQLWSASKQKMILIGVNTPHTIDPKYLEILANDDSVIIFTETTSNVSHNAFFPSIDKIISPLNATELDNLKPDILLSLGGLIVSKKIKSFLRQHQPKHHWVVNKHHANDTFFCLNKHFKTSPNTFFKTFVSDYKAQKSTYKPYWSNIKTERHNKHQDYLKDIPFCDLKAFNTIFNTIPNHTNLHLSNSSTVRYAQLFNLNPTINVFCNRGTSGIDGSTSTAIGYATSTKKPTLCITGELSFLYDSNALWNNYIPNTFRVIVINNQGGGIFRILPGHKNTDNFDTYFETKHNLTAVHLCKMYSFEYQKATTYETLTACLNNFYAPSQSPKLLEIFTPRQLNDDILVNYFKCI